MAFAGSTPGYTVAQGVDGVTVAVPLQASGITGQMQPFYGYPQAGQTTIGVPVPLQAVNNQPQLVVAASPAGDSPPQDTEEPRRHGQYMLLKEQI